jgi:NADP-dependent 3-hydroxy acid dehydrogenase YdfG
MADRSQAVLITGCSTGIGRATATRLSEHGWNVYATARRLETIEDLAELGCKTLVLDVCDEQSMRDAVSQVEQAEGAIGVLINNAGYSQSGAVESISDKDMRRQFETNVFGLVRMCRLVLPGMRERGSGKIVNISSMGGKLTFPGGGFYHATKYAVESISDAMRFEVKGFGVDVILIEPGLIVTSFGDTAAATIDGSAEGPYREFNDSVAKATEGIYNGPMRIAGGGPEVVARKIERALKKSRPRARYAVTASAHSTIALRKITPDRLWDAAMRTTFSRPRA